MSVTTLDDGGRAASRTNNSYGPLERSIRNHDLEPLMRIIRSRCTLSSTDTPGCWSWRGSKTTGGYAYMGRARTNRLVHRVVAWATDGFPGELSAFPDVHHVCGVRICVNPAHLVPATASANVLESSVRNALFERIRRLEDALRETDPGHQLLGSRRRLSGEATHSIPDRGLAYESPAARVRKLEKATQRLAEAKAHEALRFRQVIAVQKLIGAGKPRADAMLEVGISRSGYDDWKPRLQEFLRSDPS